MASKNGVTSGKEWRERSGVILTLPSGRTARVRAVGPDTILRLGRIPDMLTPMLSALMDGLDPPDPTTIEELKARTELIAVVCQCAMVDPRVVDDPQADDEIGIDDLDWYDKEFLMSVLMKSTRDLELFRDQPSGDVDAVYPDADSPPKRKRSARRAPVDAGADDGAG